MEWRVSAPKWSGAVQRRHVSGQKRGKAGQHCSGSVQRRGKAEQRRGVPGQKWSGAVRNWDGAVQRSYISEQQRSVSGQKCRKSGQRRRISEQRRGIAVRGRHASEQKRGDRGGRPAIPGSDLECGGKRSHDSYFPCGPVVRKLPERVRPPARERIARTVDSAAGLQNLA